MICYDREFPEAARALMLSGAEMIVTPNACPLTDDRVGQFRARAFENMQAAATANYPRFGGHSCAFDGMAFAAPAPPRNHRVAQARPGEEIVIARIDLDALRANRQVGPLTDAYRKPRCYRKIAATTTICAPPAHSADPWPVFRPQRVPDAQNPR
jgi:N-carbamoylputrescine amidase